jgi:hypothetical protein
MFSDKHILVMLHPQTQFVKLLRALFAESSEKVICVQQKQTHNTLLQQ